jgi:protease I
VLKQAADKRKVIAAICIAPTLLAKAGLLKYKKATVWNGDRMQEAFLKREGAIYTDEPLTIDGNIITANGPDAAEQFGKAIAEALKT